MRHLPRRSSSIMTEHSSRGAKLRSSSQFAVARRTTGEVCPESARSSGQSPARDVACAVQCRSDFNPTTFRPAEISIRSQFFLEATQRPGGAGQGQSAIPASLPGQQKPFHAGLFVAGQTTRGNFPAQRLGSLASQLPTNHYGRPRRPISHCRNFLCIHNGCGNQQPPSRGWLPAPPLPTAGRGSLRAPQSRGCAEPNNLSLGGSPPGTAHRCCTTGAKLGDDVGVDGRRRRACGRSFSHRQGGTSQGHSMVPATPDLQDMPSRALGARRDGLGQAVDAAAWIATGFIVHLCLVVEGLCATDGCGIPRNHQSEVQLLVVIGEVNFE